MARNVVLQIASNTWAFQSVRRCWKNSKQLVLITFDYHIGRCKLPFKLVDWCCNGHERWSSCMPDIHVRNESCWFLVMSMRC